MVKSKFKLRVITASILLPAFCYLVLYCSNTVFLWVTAIIAFAATVELIKLLDCDKIILQLGLAVISVMLLAYLLINNRLLVNLNFITTTSVLLAIFWVYGLITVLLYPWVIMAIKNRHCNYKSKINGKLINFIFVINQYISGLLAIIPAWIIINYLKFKDRYLLLFACSIIVTADIGAYFVGKTWGKYKLTTVSPKKTWEGLFGGYAAVLVVSSIYCILSNQYGYLYKFSGLQIIILSTATFAFSVIGDLFESVLKRISNKKDSSNILPGHGGVLDRIDGFCAAIPIFMFSLIYLTR